MLLKAKQKTTKTNINCENNFSGTCGLLCKTCNFQSRKKIFDIICCLQILQFFYIKN